MATNNQKAAPVEEQQVTKTEAFFDKYKKAIVGCVAAVIAIIVCVILVQEGHRWLCSSRYRYHRMRYSRKQLLF